MSIGESSFTHPFVVVPGPSQLPGTMLIGHDILSTFNIWLHPYSNSVWMDGDIRKLRQHSDKWGPKPLPHPSPIAHTAECHGRQRARPSMKDTGPTLEHGIENALTSSLVSRLDSQPVYNNHAGTQCDRPGLELKSPVAAPRLLTRPTPAPRTLPPTTAVANKSMLYRPPPEGPVPTEPPTPFNNGANPDYATASTLPADKCAATAVSPSPFVKLQHSITPLPLSQELPTPERSPLQREKPASHTTHRHTPGDQNPPPTLTWHMGPADHVSVDKAITIPGYSSRWVRAVAKVTDNTVDMSRGHILVDPLQATHKCLFIPPGLYNVKDHRTEIVVINKTPKSLSLAKGTPFCLIQHSNADIVDCGTLQDHLCANATLTAEDHHTIDDAMEKTLMANPIADKQYVQALRDLFAKHPSILPSKSRPLGRTSLLSHSISLVEGAKPAKIPAFRIPHSKRDILEQEIQGMLQADIIEESRSAWQAPLILIPKSDGTLRCVADFRYLNSLTLFEPYPMQTIKSLLLDIRKDSCVFSTIDLQKGFLQVPLDESSRPYTAFSAPSGHYQFKVAPLGLKNSPLTFCRLMALVLGGLMTGDLMVYVDDLLLASRSADEHIRKLDLVFDRLAVAGLTINPAKCAFFARRLTFLGHSISDAGVAPNDEKVQAILSYPTPKSARDVKRYLGVCGYYRGFIQNYGSIAAPLTSLLKKNAKFEWGPQQQTAFSTLQAALTSAPVLIFPDYSAPFHIHCDASDIGLGAVLSQYVKGFRKPIAFASRQLSPAEKNYNTTDREMQAIVWSLQHFRDVIYGYDICVWTDHAPLTTTLNATFRDPHGRRARYFMTLKDYNVKIKHIKGTQNYQPDALSRAPLPLTKPPIDESSLTFPPAFTNLAPQAQSSFALVPIPGAPIPPLTIESIREQIKTDPMFGPILHDLQSGHPPRKIKGVDVTKLEVHNGILFRRPSNKRIGGHFTRQAQMVVPEACVDTLLKIAHEGNMHSSGQKTVVWVRNRYFFPLMDKRVKKHVGSCKVCPLSKGSPNPPAPCGTYDIPAHPWERVFTDILALPASSKGHRYVIVFIDQFSRFCELSVLPDKTARSIAKALFDRVISRWGTPSVLVSDNDPAYVGEIITSLSTLLNIHRPQIMPFRPQANGFSEALNRKILSVIRTLTLEQKRNWCDWLPIIQGCLNGNYHSALGDSPDFVLLGRDKRQPHDLFHEDSLPRYTGSSTKEMCQVMKKIWQATRKALIDATTRAKRIQHMKPKNIICQGSLVFHLKEFSGNIRPKLEDKWEGPYRVLRTRTNHALCEHTLSKTQCWYHVDKLKLADGLYESSLSII